MGQGRALLLCDSKSCQILIRNRRSQFQILLRIVILLATAPLPNDHVRMKGWGENLRNLLGIVRIRWKTPRSPVKSEQFSLKCLRRNNGYLVNDIELAYGECGKQTWRRTRKIGKRKRKKKGWTQKRKQKLLKIICSTG
jgi:hypothetical protein